MDHDGLDNSLQCEMLSHRAPAPLNAPSFPNATFPLPSRSAAPLHRNSFSANDSTPLAPLRSITSNPPGLLNFRDSLQTLAPSYSSFADEDPFLSSESTSYDTFWSKLNLSTVPKEPQSYTDFWSQSQSNPMPAPFPSSTPNISVMDFSSDICGASTPLSTTLNSSLTPFFPSLNFPRILLTSTPRSTAGPTHSSSRIFGSDSTNSFASFGKFTSSDNFTMGFHEALPQSTPTTPSTRKKGSDANSLSKQERKWQKALNADLSVKEKLDKIFDALEDISWKLGDFMHHVFEHKNVHRSSTIFRDRAPTRPGEAGKRCEGGLHAATKNQLKDDEDTGKFADLATSLMHNIKAILQTTQGLFYHYILVLSTPDPVHRHGVIVPQTNRPPELV
ncbi:hypothetical protein DFH07DRAFT_785937 [Mycena maculata]|uniref:Uncharacterized protein n=1 Tax=Mycena maculata TaxID=230809 RepID=A0AAD7H6U0_9AGAR|nr:hypothetical protein DFH07DRAFT_785937 [Mycena maculata]